MGRVAKHVTDARRRRLQELLAANLYLPLGDVCQRLGISEATARRDLAALERDKLITRTHGGALGPYSGELGDFEAFFPTFDQRTRNNAKQKALIAQSFVELLRPGMTIFLDSGSSCFAVAEAIEHGPEKRQLTVVTHNIAVAVKLARVEGIEVHVVGGKLLPRQAAIFGDEACRAVAGRKIDWAVMGCESVDGKGTWNSQQDVVRLQRAALAGADRHAFLVDASKFGHPAPVFLAPWTAVDLLVTDATREQLTKAGISLPTERIRFLSGPTGSGTKRGKE